MHYRTRTRRWIVSDSVKLFILGCVLVITAVQMRAKSNVASKRRMHLFNLLSTLAFAAWMADAHGQIGFGWRFYLVLNNTVALLLAATGVYIVSIVACAIYASAHLSTEAPGYLSAVFFALWLFFAACVAASTGATLVTDRYKNMVLRHATTGILVIGGSYYVVYLIARLKCMLRGINRAIQDQDESSPGERSSSLNRRAGSSSDGKRSRVISSADRSVGRVSSDGSSPWPINPLLLSNDSKQRRRHSPRGARRLPRQAPRRRADSADAEAIQGNLTRIAVAVMVVFTAGGAASVMFAVHCARSTERYSAMTAQENQKWTATADFWSYLLPLLVAIFYVYYAWTPLCRRSDDHAAVPISERKDRGEQPNPSQPFMYSIIATKD